MTDYTPVNNYRLDDNLVVGSDSFPMLIKCAAIGWVHGCECSHVIRIWIQLKVKENRKIFIRHIANQNVVS